ncbi:MAG: hypothetical protein IT223_06170 [Crocinitomicaceae bacterium]|nr:hypothetical protein [Crocinitomicaceae bacterium]
MNNIYTLLLTLLSCQLTFAQVEVDHKIQLTGSGGDAKIEGVQTVVNDFDAANKKYVDDAISGLSGATMEFSLAASISTLSVGVGANTSVNPVILSSTFLSGGGAPVSLTLSGVPANVSYNLTPSGGYPTFTASLVFTASVSAVPGIYNIVVSANGGGGVETVPITLSVVNANVVFVTSTTQNGSLGGLTGADNICQDRADAAGLSGTYKAWLSTTSVNAKDRISDGLYVRTDGQTIAVSKADLIDGSISIPINRDEFGNIPSGETQVFTATNEFGVKWVFDSFPSINYSCVDWTSSSNPYDHTGQMGLTNTGWTQASAGQGCSYARRLYCFEQ